MNITHDISGKLRKRSALYLDCDEDCCGCQNLCESCGSEQINVGYIASYRKGIIKINFEYSLRYELKLKDFEFTSFVRELDTSKWSISKATNKEEYRIETDLDRNELPIDIWITLEKL